ncbi:hypothetical protein [Falsirhodobacter algicola]|uniref:Uncharacterized protein n=1 Tax=Falsirhodobacter algicola TaxID=2692330 RepID=A0A8J8SMC8_9RHOB|nr:hypothetical protein [Falsirhodobacter algicola]QUS37304.1 hypothetical protein GR316_13065 [Falsirhodobacter algicola]
MKRLILAVALIAVAASLAFGMWRHETARSVRFIGLVAGEEAIHPARAFQVAFQEEVPWNTTATLTGPEGAVDTVAWRLPGDRRMLMAQAAGPLHWDTPYRLCITRQRRAIVQRVVGPRVTCTAFRTQAEPAAEGPKDAPVLVALGADAAYGSAYLPILRAEGFTGRSIPAEDLDRDALKGRAVLILASRHLDEDQIAALNDWVQQGGLLIAMKPEGGLMTALGAQTLAAGTIHGASLEPAADQEATRALSGVKLGLHGPVELFRMPGGTGPGDAPSLVAGTAGAAPTAPRALGQLFDTHSTPLPYPAGVTLRRGRGTVAIFPFSLAETVVLTRQGNPFWINQERDGSAPRRPNDLFYPDFVDLDRMHVPQADELQRLMANLIVTAAPMPVPRFWYLPDDRRAVVVLTGDDHATPDGTGQMFDRLLADSPKDCDLAAWECLRASSYLTLATYLDPARAAAYSEQGFELGVHVDSGCHDVPSPELDHIIGEQFDEFQDRYPDLPAQRSERLHCIVWNGWTDVPEFERARGVRFDLNYYSWPPNWLQQRPGFMTGSGFPMPFVDYDGRVLDIYQTATHLVNEDGVPQDFGIASLLDRALGSDQYFGAFAAHVDYTDSYADRIIDAAEARGVALVSSEQMLEWLDGRNASDLRAGEWDGSTLRFTVDIRPGAEHATILLPRAFGAARLTTVTCGGQRLTQTDQQIKGIDYAAFQTETGRCEARYGVLSQLVPPSTKTRDVVLVTGDPAP